MPAKACPACGLKNPASATQCDCGRSFGGDSTALTRQLICPECNWVNPQHTTDCRCGHSFDEARLEERDVLTHHLTTAWFAIVGGMVLVLGGVGLAALQIMLGAGRAWLATGLVGGGVGLILKGSRGVHRARLGLDALPARPIAPPRARMLKK